MNNEGKSRKRQPFQAERPVELPSTKMGNTEKENLEIKDGISFQHLHLWY